MTRLPRNLSGGDLIKRPERQGYRVSRQSGSPIRATCDAPEPYHVTVPNHDPLRVGTLAAILADVARRHRLSRDELIDRLLA